MYVSVERVLMAVVVLFSSKLDGVEVSRGLMGVSAGVLYAIKRRTLGHETGKNQTYLSIRS